MAKTVSRKSKRRLMTLGVLSIAAIGYFCVTLVGYIYSYVSLKQEEKQLKGELTNLQEQKANLKIEIQKLNDPEYVARYAKEKYLYSSNGEYVLKIETKNENKEDIENTKNPMIYVIGGGAVFLVGVLLLVRKKRKVIKNVKKVS